MAPARIDQLAKACSVVGSRRRLLGGGISGAAAALGARLSLARAQDCDCGPGFVCADGVCRPIRCPRSTEPCRDDPNFCCRICQNCQPQDLCWHGECFGPVFENRATCVVGEVNGYITRDVMAASADGRLALVARTITERAAGGDSEEGRVHLILAVTEDRTPQLQIDAVVTRAHGITLTAEYGPAFAGVRTLTVQSAPGKDPVIDIDKRGADATPAVSVDPTFAAAAGELETALSGDLRTCFAGGSEASPVAGSPVPDGQATCQTCFDVCGEELVACIAQGGPAVLSDPAGGVDAVVACTAAWERCVNSCGGSPNC
jgi:hypothetical protein